MVAPVSATVGGLADGTLCRAVSFRSRLRLFFALIVIVPMVALAIVVFLLTERSETGKVDAGVAAGVRAAFGAHAEAADATAPALATSPPTAGFRRRSDPDAASNSAWTSWCVNRKASSPSSSARPVAS